MSGIVLVIQLLLAFSLIGIVLIQRTNQSGLGLGDGDGGGGMSGLLSGRGTANFLTRTTAMLGAGFLVACIVSAVLVARDSGINTNLDSLTLQPDGATEGATPAVPSALTPAGASDGASDTGANEPLVPAN